MEEQIKQLSQYLKDQLALGVPEDTLKQASLAQGWDEANFTKALTMAKFNVPLPPTPASPVVPAPSPAPLSKNNIEKENSNDVLFIKTSHKFMAFFSYLGIFFWIPVFFCKNNNFVKFHIRQGFVIFIFEVFAGLLAFFDFKIWLALVICLILTICIVFSLIGIIFAIKGKEKNLFIFSKISEKISFPFMRIL